MEETFYFDDVNTSKIICSIQFIIILDNSGKRIYCKYYNNNYKTIKSQIEFEKQLCKITVKYNVDKSDLDIINFNGFNILCKINKEIAIFIGQNENDNEILLEKVYNEFETQLFNIIEDSPTRENLFNFYYKIILLIDEIIYDGIVLNDNSDSLYNRIFKEKLENKDNNNSSINSIFSKWTGFFRERK